MIKGNIPFVEAEDEAAFYGPKIDVQVSVIGKEFSLATNQVDFAQPARFDTSSSSTSRVWRRCRCASTGRLSARMSA